MKFVMLTDAQDNSVIHVNPEKIGGIEQVYNEYHDILATNVLVYGHIYHVRETPQQIFNLIYDV